MQAKVQAEGEKEKELYEKFMCYCKTGGSDLSASIAAAEGKTGQLPSAIEEAEASLSQLKEDVKQAQVDRSSAKAAMAEATALREKEAAAYAAEKADFDTNLAALAKATAALEKGMSGAFLQTTSAQVLRSLITTQSDMLDVDRQELTAFLSGTTTDGYAPQSGEITGILNQMKDTMTKALADATSAEKEAIGSFEALMAAKDKEVKALSAAIESKTKRIGEVGVDIVAMKEDLTDTEASLMEDQKFLADLSTNCAKKTGEWEERSKTRSEELVALAETVKVLNDDDALDLFKKTLPGASASSFVQVHTGKSVQDKALGVLREAGKSINKKDRRGLDLLVLALSGKRALSQGGFDKVVKMIDDMVAILKTEQMDDEHKKEYCAAQLDQADDKKKGLERDISDAENAIDEAVETIKTTTEEIAALEKGIKELDKDVAEQTEQRKEENVEYTELMASDSAAKELLGFAKNRLNKFYNPKQYKAPPKVELSREDKIVSNMGGSFVQIHAHKDVEAPAPPPATWDAYSKKSEESTGVIGMIDMLIADLDKEMTEAETGEKDAQADYEKFMGDSAEKRTTDSKALASKGSAKADLEGDLESYKSGKASSTKELMATLKYVESLHGECDWLLQYFDVRKEARSGEIDALTKAKAVLNGADYSLLQTKARFLGSA